MTGATARGARARRRRTASTGAALATAAGAALLAGCPGGSTEPDPSTCHFGDGAGPLQLVVVVPSGDGVEDLAPGGEVTLVQPPQFGRIVLVGVRATGLDGCHVTVNAALRDPCGGRVVGLEERPVVLAPRGDGWAVPFQPAELSNYANVALCPPPPGLAVLGATFDLEVRVTDGRGRTAMVTTPVRPACPASDPSCAGACAEPGPPLDAGCARPDAGGDAGGDAGAP